MFSFYFIFSLPGFVVPNVDFPPLCHSQFKPGPPSEQAQAATQFMMDVMQNSDLLDLKQLCVVPGKLAWVLNVDLVCLNYDGSVLDCCVKALVAAMRSLRLFKASLKLPDTELDDEDSEAAQSEAIGGVMTAAELREAVEVDFSQSVPIKINSQPISCTVAIFEDKMLVDPTDEEESMASALVTIVLDGASHEVVHFLKAGGSAVSRQQIQECTALAKKQAKQIVKAIEKAAPLPDM